MYQILYSGESVKRQKKETLKRNYLKIVFKYSTFVDSFITSLVILKFDSKISFLSSCLLIDISTGPKQNPQYLPQYFYTCCSDLYPFKNY